MAKAIQVENLSKQYRLGQIGTGSLAHDMNRWWHTVRGKEDPYLKIGEANDRTTKGSSEYVWSLRDVNFEIEQGDSVGIIGRNGAGKSTLLKILSRVTAPTTGSLKVKGRIASLLEVGTGFHPELSGRDNIFLNGAILGMRKHEIKKKFDEIVDFAGVERYIDTPVKRYSSGMYVRLAFAVAAYLESEILIVDEVLAVGDAEFQKKCLGKMGDISKGEGRTILFVSHNMGSIAQLCNSCILLKSGIVELQGSPEYAIEKYYSGNNVEFVDQQEKDADIFLKEYFTCDENGQRKINFGHSNDIHIRIKIGINKFDSLQNIGLVLLTRDKRRVFTVNKPIKNFYTSGNEATIDFTIDGGIIAPMDYSFLIALNSMSGQITYDWKEDVCPIKVYDDGTGLGYLEGLDYGCIVIKENWKAIQ
jgi:lipopolysaccharide transport system ATP-binding protein